MGDLQAAEGRRGPVQLLKPRAAGECSERSIARMMDVIDRLRLGQVIDFINAHWGEHYFPAFNVADSAISIGICLLLLDMLLQDNAERLKKAAAPREGDAA